MAKARGDLSIWVGGWSPFGYSKLFRRDAISRGLSPSMESFYCALCTVGTFSAALPQFSTRSQTSPCRCYIHVPWQRTGLFSTSRKPLRVREGEWKPSCIFVLRNVSPNVIK
jgi:hypothetical protein